MEVKEFNFNDEVDTLKNSSMFYMSLGSKELFHSNFLHWLSIINFDVFLKIMHGLSYVDKFWWEDRYKPNSNNIEVRREFHNFDLSIYIKVDKKCHRNGEPYDVWLPVLILENKMKSLAYQDQLDGYLGKVYEEWHDYYKSDIENNWDATKVSFIVLSLVTPSLNGDSQYGKIKCDWFLKNYEELSIILLGQVKSIVKEFDKSIIEDYCSFVKALFDIANNDWKIDPANSYISKVCPRYSNDEDVKQKVKQLEELRIYDIREKIVYDQLINLLQKELVNAELGIGVERYKKDSYDTYKPKHQSTNLPKIICNTNFFHGVGLFEAIYLIRGRKNAKDEPFFLTVQIQGKHYTRGISRKNIVKIDNQTQIVNGKPHNKKVNCIKDLTDIGKEKLKFHIDDIDDPSNILGKYDNSFIYTKREIDRKVTIKELIYKIVENIKEIVANANKLDEPQIFKNYGN